MTTPTFTEEYRAVDRSQWGSGPWDSEPDKVVWKDEATGLDCMANRGAIGAWCGYVGLPKDHPWHGFGYDQHLSGLLPCEDHDRDEWSCCYSHSPGALVSVHGGLTFADSCHEAGDPATAICHRSDDGDPVWWFGFDCAHHMDAAPMHATLFGGAYKDLDYVVAEVRSLAAQLIDPPA